MVVAIIAGLGQVVARKTKNPGMHDISCWGKLLQ
jgi:hypothetical protein